MTSGNDGGDGADRRLVAVGATLAAAAVTFGAFGTHSLKGRIGAEALGWWHTAVEYQMWHSLAVVGLGLSASPRFRLPAWMFIGGTLVFSSTLYALALGSPRWIGAVTPIGGIALISGWISLAWRAHHKRTG